MACADGAIPSRLLCMCCRHPLLVTSPTAGAPPCTHSPHRYTNRCSPIDPTPPHIQPAPSACMQVRYGVEDRDPPHNSTPPQRISTLHTPHACRSGTAHSSISNTPHACRRGTLWRTGIPPACQRRWSALWRSASPRRQPSPAPAVTACTMAPAWAGCTDPSGGRRCGGRGVGVGAGKEMRCFPGHGNAMPAAVRPKLSAFVICSAPHHGCGRMPVQLAGQSLALFHTLILKCAARMGPQTGCILNQV